MRIEEVRVLTTESLRDELQKAYKELFSLRFQKATRQLADTSAIGKARKNLARVHTALRERELAQ